jgi:hypothetical protein
MNTLQKIILLFALLFACLPANAQKDLEIETTVFKSYGKQEGSVLIELGKDVLGNHTKISHYKSLIIPSDSTVINATLKAIRKDVEDGKILMESRKDGKIETGYYCLKKKKDSWAYEYILFTNKSRKMTLIYIKGDFPPDQLEDELHELKNLFIRVNNKQIKL